MNPDHVFEAHYPIIKGAFARHGVEIDVAYLPPEERSVNTGQRDAEPAATADLAGRDDGYYAYGKGRLLTVAEGDNIQKLQTALPGIDPIGELRAGQLVVLSLDGVEGRPSVPQALDIIDHMYPEDAAAADKGALPLATPDHIVDIAKMCTPTEPEVPTGNAPQPWPKPRPASGRWWRPPLRGCKRRVRIAAVDIGLLRGADTHWWLKGVQGDPDELQQRQGRPPLITPFQGHGTFVAGVARCMAPDADVWVANHLPASGAELESSIVDKLNIMIRDRGREPDLISLSAGSYHRKNWLPLSFEKFHQEHPTIPLIAAAGNDSTNRRFYPAAAKWAISVGALGADEQHLAWFSNRGPWVNVYALGEGIVNAYATGEYDYIVPPKRGAIQTFHGMARWSGTSFSTPLVAGLIADEMWRTDSNFDMAAQAVLGRAEDLDGVGRVLRTS